MNESHVATEIPSWRLTDCASNDVLCGTFTAPLLLPRATASVLLQTTRMLVNCAVVANVPSHAVASRTYGLVVSFLVSDNYLGLHAQNIVGTAGDDLGDDVELASHRVDCDDSAFDVQRIQ